jgi:hypothetical protein
VKVITINFPLLESVMSGIDYGLGRLNIDHITGIRFGILNANDPLLSEWLWESIEGVYFPHCPDCGEKLSEGSESCACGASFSEEDVYGDSPDENIISEEGYSGFVDSHNDIWVTRSPFYTHATFCSPCAPGACSLSCPDEDGGRCYCFDYICVERRSRFYRMRIVGNLLIFCQRR